MKVADIKKKVAAKVAKGKAKIAAKCGKSGKAAKACAVLALLVVFTGCHMGEQPTAQRAQTANTEVKFLVADGGNATFNFGAEFVSQAQANETSGTETMTASPSNTPTASTPIQIDARYNDAAKAAGGVLETFLASLAPDSATELKKFVASGKDGSLTVTKTDGTTETVTCKGGVCSDSAGTCLSGNCSD